MADQAPTGNNGYLSDMDIRVFLRDHDPAANLLLQDLEFTPEELRTAQTLAVDFWNEEPPNMPRFNYTLYNFPFRYNLLVGTCAKLAAIAEIAFRRNKLKAAIAGGAVDDQNKDAEYGAAATRLWEEYTGWVRRKKRELNMGQGWGQA